MSNENFERGQKRSGHDGKRSAEMTPVDLSELRCKT